MSTDLQTIAELLFPDVTESPEAILAHYPARNLPVGACVTRYAPSPTGFVHLGSLYTALISKKIADQTKGVFILRVEDTDKEREVENGIALIAEGLHKFGLDSDEGITADGSGERGVYGPYVQSHRRELYKVFIKELVVRGGAYPCFCTPEELDSVRATQELQKIKTGYYGVWARHRDITVEEVAERLAKGEKPVIRVRSRGVEGQKFSFKDAVKGGLTLTANDQDAILFKSDGYPTYHWAHVVDDYLMKTTHVIRGEEWLPSAPLHIELFELMNWKAPIYCHVSLIMKLDGGTKRKLSKRKDPEANVEFYAEQGIPKEAVIEYLMNLANSSFEDWRREHPAAPMNEFVLKLEKINVSGALFDMTKLLDISKNVISRMNADEVFARVLAWAEEYDAKFARLISKNAEYALAIFGIERGGDKKRKDIAAWSELDGSVGYFFDEVFDLLPTEGFDVPESVGRAAAAELLEAFLLAYNPKASADDWLAEMKSLGVEHGFAADTKQFKAAPPGTYRGHFGDVAMVIRRALTKRAQTPDLFEMLQVMGERRIQARVAQARAFLK